MRKIIYWSRALSDDVQVDRAKRIFSLLEACASKTDIVVEDWSELAGDAAFFDRLNRMRFDNIRDGVIVVMDKCTLADFRFSPISLFNVRAQHIEGPDRLEQDRVKRGAATALILRNPGVWPIFINAGSADEVFILDEEIRNKLASLEAVLPRGDHLRPPMQADVLRQFSSFVVNQHFISEAELEGAAAAGALPRALHAPALGALPLFDPTGLRTIVKSQLLYEMLLLKSSNAPGAAGREHGATQRAIATLLERLRHPAVVAEEETDFAYLAAYSLFRHGRRVWTVSNFKFFRDGVWREDVAWADPAAGGSALVIRDYDLRFVDLQANEQSVDLRNIDDWRCGKDDESEPINVWISNAWWRVCSSFSAVKTPVEIEAKADYRRLEKNWRLGVFLNPVAGKGRKKRAPNFLRAHDQNDPGMVLVGVQKPIKSVLFVTDSIEDAFLPARGTLPPRRDIFTLAYRTLLARWNLQEIVSGSGSRHAPPPVNLEVASSLLDRVRIFRGTAHPNASVYAAVMALEAYEVLMGKSKSTSMEALQQVYLAETQIETQGVGLSSRIELLSKEQDIEFSLRNFFGSRKIEEVNRERDYAAKIWSGVRTMFRSADMFQAANEANTAVLTNQEWFGVRRLLWDAKEGALAPFRGVASFFGVRRDAPADRRLTDRAVLDQRHLKKKGRIRLRVSGRQPITEWVKRLIAGIATDPGEWAKAFFWFWVIATVIKVVVEAAAGYFTKGALVFLREAQTLLQEPGLVLMASLSSQFTQPPTGPWALILQFYQIVFLSINTLFMAFLVAMIVRQVTRD